jgi:hypothetical protein
VGRLAAFEDEAEEHRQPPSIEPSDHKPVIPWAQQRSECGLVQALGLRGCNQPLLLGLIEDAVLEDLLDDAGVVVAVRGPDRVGARSGLLVPAFAVLALSGTAYASTMSEALATRAQRCRCSLRCAPCRLCESFRS